MCLEKNTADVRKCTRSGRAGASARTSKPIENRVFSIERVSARIEVGRL